MRSSVGALRIAATFSRISIEPAPLPCASHAFWSFQIERITY
jgi:hypothetical protein